MTSAKDQEFEIRDWFHKTIIIMYGTKEGISCCFPIYCYLCLTKHPRLQAANNSTSKNKKALSILYKNKNT